MRTTRFWAAALVITLTVAVRIYPALSLGNKGPDFNNYLEMGTMTLRGDNIYAVHPLFPYMPFSQVIPAACVGLADSLGVSFQVLLKLVNVAGDTVLAVALLLVLWRRTAPASALLWTLGFVLNPVSILVSAFHGNLMALVPVFVGLAMVVGERSRDVPRPAAPALVATAALLLGIAIALRSFPVLLLPAFALWLARSTRGVVCFAVLALAPSVVSALPYLLWATPDFLQEVFSYSGSPDMGWLAALRGIPILVRDLKLVEFGAGLLEPSKVLFLVACAVSLVALPSSGPDGRQRAILLPPLLFVGLYGGVAAQYLVWVIPAAVLTRDRWLAAYTGLATAAMVAHYLVFHPAILFATPPTVPPEGLATSVVLVLGNGALAALGCVWAARILRDEGRGSSPRIQRSLVAGGALVLTLFAALFVRGLIETRHALEMPVVEAPR